MSAGTCPCPLCTACTCSPSPIVLADTPTLHTPCIISSDCAGRCPSALPALAPCTLLLADDSSSRLIALVLSPLVSTFSWLSPLLVLVSLPSLSDRRQLFLTVGDSCRLVNFHVNPNSQRTRTHQQTHELMPPKKPNKADAIEELCDMIEKRKLKAQTALTKAIDARSIDLMRCVCVSHCRAHHLHVSPPLQTFMNDFTTSSDTA